MIQFASKTLETQEILSEEREEERKTEGEKEESRAEQRVRLSVST